MMLYNFRSTVRTVKKIFFTETYFFCINYKIICVIHINCKILSYRL